MICDLQAAQEQSHVLLLLGLPRTDKAEKGIHPCSMYRTCVHGYMIVSEYFVPAGLFGETQWAVHRVVSQVDPSDLPRPHRIMRK